ncbi:MAG TPA: TetR-like C-terminal domain-containing protein [Caulobacteraceae bacterium]
MGRAYVAFVRSHPGLFSLMFRNERLDDTRPALREAILGARQALRRSSLPVPPGKAFSPLQMAAQSTARRSLVHGFSLLMLEGRLADIVRSLPAGDDEDSLLDAVLQETLIGVA